MIKSKKQMYIVVGAFVLVLMLFTTTYAFFNYTRTGSANIIKTGRIAFNSTQGQAINLTNVFPIDVTNGIPNNNANVGSVTINVTGDTTYTDGVEYLVSAVNVQNTIGSGASAKSLPISIDVSVEDNIHGEAPNETTTTLGTVDEDYFTHRGANSNTSIYKVLVGETISTDDQLLVGYIKSGEEGIDGNIVIKAYIDKAKVGISDTYPEEETDTNNDGYIDGTPASFGENREIFTTTEWNSLQQDGVSFQVKVEANEGIWVTNPDGSQEEVWNATDVSCFTYTEENNEITITDYDEGTCGTDVVIPKKINNLNVTTIYYNAFNNKGLTSVEIPNTITQIGEYSFASNQLSNITIPSSVITIYEYAFSGNNLTSVVIPSGVIYIDYGAFAYNEITDISIPSTVESFGFGDSNPVFEDNPLTNVYIDKVEIYAEDLTTLGPGQIETLILGPHVQSIGESALEGNNLSSVTIPSSVTSIENYAFANNQLTSVTIKGKNSSNDFDSYGNYIWGWDDGYDDSNIIWEGSN